MAYEYFSSTYYGNETGPSGGYNKFKTAVQYKFVDTGSKWTLYRRLWVQCTKSAGENFSTNFHCSWLSSTISIGGNGTGKYGDTGWVKQKDIAYGSNIDESHYSYYTNSSGQIKSTVGVDFNAASEPKRTLTLKKGTGVASFTGGGSHHIYTRAATKAVAATGYSLEKYVGTSSDGESTNTWTNCAGLASHEDSWYMAVNRTVTVYAKANTYTITYEANGGSDAPASQSYTYSTSDSINLSSDIPTRKGFDFLGWSQQQDATVAEFVPGQAWSTSNASNYTLYAVWEKATNMCVNTSDGWKEGTPYVYTEGTWKEPSSISIFANGVWNEQ